MFKEFAETIGKAHIQLMEGAITFEEFYNKTAFEVIELSQTERYAEFLRRNPNGDPMGEDPENATAPADRASWNVRP